MPGLPLPPNFGADCPAWPGPAGTTPKTIWLESFGWSAPTNQPDLPLPNGAWQLKQTRPSLYPCEYIYGVEWRPEASYYDTTIRWVADMTFSLRCDYNPDDYLGSPLIVNTPVGFTAESVTKTAVFDTENAQSFWGGTIILTFPGYP